MNTEHQNKKPQLPDLPRSVEEKPIVYDDADLEEIRKWYNMRMKEEQQLMKLFVSLKTLEVKLAGAANLKATYTPQEW